MGRFINAFGENLRPLCSDRFATHVLEALVTQTYKNSLKEIDLDLKMKYKDFTLKVGKFLLNNLEDFIWDTYGNHVIRKILENMSGLIPDNNSKIVDNKNKKVNDNDEIMQADDENKNLNEKINSSKITLDILEEYKEVVKDYAERLITWPQFKELPYTEISSGLLQILLKAVAKIDTKILKKYLKKLLKESFAPNAAVQEDDENEQKNLTTSDSKLPDVFMSKSCMMLLEVALQLAPSKLFTQIYAKCFVGKILKLSKLRATNFSVQKLFTHVTEKVEFESMFEEVCEHFKEIIGAGHTGVILSIAQSCKRLISKQGAFMQNLMKALDCFEPIERQKCFILCLARFLSFEENAKCSNENLQKEKLSLHGTLILQLLLEFNKPIKIVNGLLEMDVNEVKNLFSNSMGSHIVDSYVSSVFVGEKSRERLTRKMCGTYRELVVSKYGSRSFEAIWRSANLKLKLVILDELSEKDAAWCNSEFGKIIAGKINFSLFKRNKETWKSNLSSSSKPKNLLDVLE